MIAFVRLLFHLLYGQTEGFNVFLLKHIYGLTVSDHSTINRRINRLGIDIEGYLIKSNEPVSIAVDASVVKVNNERYGVRNVWKVRKGYPKVHFIIDIKTKQVVAMDDERFRSIILLCHVYIK